MKLHFKTILAFAVLLIIAITAHAAVVYQYGFENLPGNNTTTASPWTGTPDVLAAGLSASSWATNYSGGFISYSGSCGTTACQALSISHNDYPASTTYTLTFTVNSGYSLSVTDLSFWDKESGTGPTTANITINGTAAVNNLTLAGTTGGNTGALTPVNSFTNLTGTFTLVMTLTGATSTAGTFRLDDFVVDGTVISTSGLNLYGVTGGGGYCPGSNGVAIGLASSDTGVTYQLKNSSYSNMGNAVAGTGSAITFGLQTAAGTYTVVGTKNSNLDTAIMTGSATVVINAVPTINIATPPAQCGGFVTLDAGNAGSTYLWSDNSTAQTNAVGSTSTVTVTVTNSNTCSASASVSVIINTAPSIFFNITNANICAGMQTTITANGALNYVWSDNETTTTITVQPVSNATYLVTGTDANNCSATGASSVNVSAAVTSSITAQICQGLSYYGHTTAGTYIDTIPSVGSCDSIRTLTLTVLPATVTNASQTICSGQSFAGHNTGGTYSDTLSAVGGCDSIVTLTLTVLPAITGASSTQTICNGASYNGHTVAGNFSDTLSNGNGCDSIVNLTLIVLPQPSIAITRSICQRDTFMGHTTSGNYADTVIASNGCDSIIYLQLTVNPLPHTTLYLTFDTVCNNAATIVMSGGSPAGGYYTGQGIVDDSLFVPSVAPIGKDTIYYNFVDSNGCFKARYEYAHTLECDSTLGIEESSASMFSVMPNPTHDYLTIEGTTTNENCMVNLYDMLGRLLLSQPFGVKTAMGKTILSLHELPSGVYLLNIVQGNNKVYNTKIIKE